MIKIYKCIGPTYEGEQELIEEYFGVEVQTKIKELSQELLVCVVAEEDMDGCTKVIGVAEL